MPKVLLFPRNQIQVKFFAGVADELEETSTDCCFISADLNFKRNQTFHYEDKLKSVMASLDLASELIRIRNEYPKTNFNLIIQSEREYCYFPWFFNQKPVCKETIYRHMAALFIIFENYLNDTRPDLVVSEMVTGLVDGVLFDVASKRGIPYLGIRASKLTNGIVFCDNLYDRPVGFVERLHSRLSISEKAIELSKQHIQSLNRSIETPHYMEASRRKFQFFSVRKVGTFLKRYITERPKRAEVTLYNHDLLYPFLEHLKKFRNARWSSFDDDLIDAQLSAGQKFFLYPAHYEPEASTSIRAFYYSDQVGLIKHISKMLPVETTLIVKEHKGNNGFRDPRFYRELRYLPNVLIASPGYPTQTLINKACAVMVLTGRVGWEALVRGVPVIGFGNTFWSDHVSVIKPPQTPEKFSAALQALSDLNRKQLSVDTEYTEKMAAAYIDCVKPGVFVHGAKRFLTKENYQLVARGILEFAYKASGSS